MTELGAMTKSELIARLAERHPHLVAADAELAVKTIIDAMVNSLVAGERIEIRGFGSFSLNFRPPRQGRNPKTGDKVGVVSGVRWTNVAISQHPVNQHVGGVMTIPFGVLAKSWGAGGLNITKALEASYATDAAAKTGGAAFGAQSLDTGGAPYSYFDFRDKLAAALKSGAVRSQSPDGLVEYPGRCAGKTVPVRVRTTGSGRRVRRSS